MCNRVDTVSQPAHIETEKVVCPVCQSEDSNVIGQGHDFEYKVSSQEWASCQCTMCNHIFLNPRPRISFSSQIYPNSYYTADLQRKDNSSRVIVFLRGLIERKRYRSVVKLLPEFPRVLDIGFGDGRVLQTMQYLLAGDGEFIGLDLGISDDVAKKMDDLNIQYIEDLAEEYDYGVDAYNLIILTQVIEHFWQPNELLRKLHKALKPNGVIFIETPNPDCFCRKWQGDTYWGGHHRPRHMNLFNRQGLEKMAKKSGFDLVEYKEFAVPAFWVMGYRNKHGLSALPFSSESFREHVNMGNIVALSFFTVVEILAGWFGFGKSNHRVVLIKNEKE